MRYFCTLFDQNYLTRGLVLYDSLVKYCPFFILWILCLDDKTYKILKKMHLPRARLITLKEFETKRLIAARRNRTHQEYCWTCASALLWYLLNKYSEIKLLSYLDSDLKFYSDPAPIFTEMRENSVLIIPHCFDQKHEHQIVNGIYNVSLISFRNDFNGRKCLRWWRDQCLDWCYYRVEDGKLGDQGYLDQFSKKFKGVHSLKHVGAGLAHWNIGQYKIQKDVKAILVDDLPLIFFHFQGLKIPLPYFLGSKSVNGPYSRSSPFWSILYEPYIDSIYAKTKVVRKLAKGFHGGLIVVDNKIYYIRLVAMLVLTLARVVRKKINTFVLRYFIKVLGFGIDIIDQIPFQIDHPMVYCRAFKSYLLQNECSLFSDCVLLWKLKAQQPPGADRYIEYPWVYDRLLKTNGGKILDVGASNASMWVKLLPVRFTIYGIDPNTQIFSSRVIWKQGDIRSSGYKNRFFDNILCISTLEHIGIKGRYQSDDDLNGDKRAMAEMQRILKPGGKLFLTLPYGKKDILPINKLYNRNRLTALLSGWTIEERQYVKFDTRHKLWLSVDEKEAAKTDMLTDRWYALCLIVARKNK